MTVTTELPAGIHADVLTGTDVTNGQAIQAMVVWSDRPYDSCPRCGQPVAREITTCPARLNTGAGHDGEVESWSQQHHCGEWLSVPWTETTTGKLAADAARLAADLAESLDEDRIALQRRLERDLADALDTLAMPLEDDETPAERAESVRTGSAEEPGVCWDGFTAVDDDITMDQVRALPWEAWDYHPDGSGNPVIVLAEEL